MFISLKLAFLVIYFYVATNDHLRLCFRNVLCFCYFIANHPDCVCDRSSAVCTTTSLSKTFYSAIPAQKKEIGECFSSGVS